MSLFSRIPDDNNIHEVAGFDLGHGETAIAKTYPLTSDPPGMMYIQGKRSIISALAVHPTRGILIGDEAYETSDQERLQTRFKSPAVHRSEVADPIRLFVRKTIDVLVETGEISDSARAFFIVGHPAGWSEEVLNRYGGMLREVGMTQLVLVPEPRAAFLYARYSGDLRVGEDLLQGTVLVVDIGSSTTDFTLINEKNVVKLDFGHNVLGGGLLDVVILQRALSLQEQEAELRDIFEKYPVQQVKCEIVCRKVKEKFFSNESRFVDEPAAEYSRISASQRQGRLHFDAELYFADFHETFDGRPGIIHTPIEELGGRSWYATFRDELLRIQETMGSYDPGLILMTGGGSRMKFTRELCEEIFPESKVRVGSEPAFAIAKGLAIAGRFDLKIKVFRSRIEDFLSEDTVETIVNHHYPTFASSLAETICPYLIDTIIPETVLEWKAGNISTLSDIAPVLSERINKWMQGEEGSRILIPTIRSWLEEITPHIAEHTDRIADQFDDIRASSLLLDPNTLMPANISASTNIGSLTGFAPVATFTIIASTILAMYTGVAGIALMTTGPISWIAGALTGAAMFGGASRAREEIWTSDIDMWIRRSFPKKMIISNIKKSEAQFIKQTTQQLVDDIEARERLVNQVAGQIRNELEESARAAEWLIK